MGKPIESRKDEVRFVTDDPKRMLGKWVARRALHTWKETFTNEETGKVEEIERNEVLLERGTYIDQDTLSSIRFMMSDGSLKEVEVSNQNRQGMLLQDSFLMPFKAVVKIDKKKKTIMLYASSVANALIILVDYIELNFKGGFVISKVEEMDYCIVIIDNLKSAEARKYEIDVAYLKGEISMEDFVETTCDNISEGNPDEVEEPKDKETKKFYQIGAHIVRHNEKEGDEVEDGIFIVQTISAVRANMLIEHYLRTEQDKRYQESLKKHPERTFVKYQINSFIEESKILPISCFIPKSFSMIYATNDDR